MRTFMDLRTGKIFSTVELDVTHSRTMLVPFKLIFSQVELNPEAATIPVEVQAFRLGHWDHAVYGPVDITHEVFADMITNFENNAYGQDLPVTYEHGLDRSRGLEAAGWVRGISVAGDALRYSIEFTREALSEIQSGKWRYFSPEYADEYTNKETGESFNNVVVGGSLTNAPFFKGMQPLNFSEFFEEVDEETEAWIREQLGDVKEFAQWSTAYKNDLPDSAFMYIEPGGSKDSSGKTIPRSKRHFPFKDSSGKVDQIHVAKVVQLAPKSNLSQSIKDRVTARAKKLLGGQKNASEYDEGGDEGVNREQLLRFAEQLNVAVADTDTDEEITTKCFSALSQQSAELEPLRKLKQETESQKSFSEMFPEQAAKMARLEKNDRNSSALLFSESYTRFWTEEAVEGAEPKRILTTMGFSTLAKDKIKEFHISLSEGSPDPEKFAEILDLVANGKGIVNYKVTGSSTSGTAEEENEDTGNNPKPGTMNARQRFHELTKKVAAREENKEKDFNEILSITATEYPDDYEAWQAPMLAGSNGGN